MTSCRCASRNWMRFGRTCGWWRVRRRKTSTSWSKALSTANATPTAKWWQSLVTVRTTGQRSRRLTSASPWYISQSLNHCSLSAAMHTRGLYRRAVSVRPSVCPGVCHVRVFCRNEKTFSNFFTDRKIRHSRFSTSNRTAIFRRGPPNGGVECRWHGSRIRLR